MAYTTFTLAQGLSDLGRRLYDPDSVFWTDAEKTGYLRESVRTFAALTNFYRNTFHFPTVIGQHWYDLTTVTNTLRSLNVTDEELYTQIEYHLLEPPTGAVWTGTRQFNIDDLATTIQIRRDQLLFDTGCTLVRSTQPANGTMTNNLPQTVIDIRRLAYLPDTGSPSCMYRDDNWAQQAYARNRMSIGTPRIYKQSTQLPLAFRTNCPPPPGTYELLTVNAGDILDPDYPGTVINIPDDWTWGVKWGAMAELFSRESAARDPMRAAYCEQRYMQAVAALRIAPALLNAEIEYTQLNVDAVFSGDTYRPGWQAEAQNTPDAAYVAGLNYIALAPKPSSILLVTLDVLENSPFPAALDDYFQFGREDYDAILDHAQHIASFKQGGAEFLATIPLFKEFYEHCAQYNDKLLAMGEYTDILFSQSALQEQADGVRATPPSSTAPQPLPGTGGTS